jgi:hypothetical protein
LTPVECLTFEFQYRLYTLPRDSGIVDAGSIKTAVQASVLPVRDELIVHLFGQIPVSVWMVLCVTILGPILSDKAFPLNNVFVCFVPLIFTNPFTNCRYSPQQQAHPVSSSCQSISIVKKPATIPGVAVRFVTPPGISALFTQALYFELGQSAFGDFVMVINFLAVVMNP